MAEGLSEDQMSHEMLATRKSEPSTMAAIWTFSMTVREIACHCGGEKAPGSHSKKRQARRWVRDPGQGHLTPAGRAVRPASLERRTCVHRTCLYALETGRFKQVR